MSMTTSNKTNYLPPEMLREIMSYLDENKELKAEIEKLKADEEYEILRARFYGYKQCMSDDCYNSTPDEDVSIIKDYTKDMSIVKEIMEEWMDQWYSYGSNQDEWRWDDERETMVRVEEEEEED